jgi:hypothetical protein
MTSTLVATLFGLVLGLAAAFGDTAQFLLVLVFGVVGLFVGRVLDGAVDLSPYLGGRDGERSRR